MNLRKRRRSNGGPGAVWHDHHHTMTMVIKERPGDKGRGYVASSKTMTTKMKMVMKTNKPMTRAPKIKMVDFQSMKARIAARAMRRKIAVKVNTF